MSAGATAASEYMQSGFSDRLDSKQRKPAIDTFRVSRGCVARGGGFDKT